MADNEPMRTPASCPSYQLIMSAALVIYLLSLIHNLIVAASLSDNRCKKGLHSDIQILIVPWLARLISKSLVGTSLRCNFQKLVKMISLEIYMISRESFVKTARWQVVPVYRGLKCCFYFPLLSGPMQWNSIWHLNCLVSLHIADYDENLFYYRLIMALNL